jgi:competence protein ComEA
VGERRRRPLTWLWFGSAHRPSSLISTIDIRLEDPMRTLVASALALTAVLFAASIGSAQQADKPAGGSATINLNSATLEQLEALPGIGPKTAQLILEYRQKSGGFKKVEELMNIKGIGEKSFLKLKPMLVVTAKPEKSGGAH